MFLCSRPRAQMRDVRAFDVSQDGQWVLLFQEFEQVRNSLIDQQLMLHYRSTGPRESASLGSENSSYSSTIVQ